MGRSSWIKWTAFASRGDDPCNFHTRIRSSSWFDDAHDWFIDIIRFHKWLVRKHHLTIPLSRRILKKTIEKGNIFWTLWMLAILIQTVRKAECWHTLWIGRTDKNPNLPVVRNNRTFRAPGVVISRFDFSRSQLVKCVELRHPAMLVSWLYAKKGPCIRCVV